MNKKIIVSVLLVFAILFTLASCDVNATTGDREKISYYFESKDGSLNDEKWISFVGEEWCYYDGEKGTAERDGSAIVLKTEEGVWGTGRFSDGNFILSRNGRNVTYYAVGNKLPEKQTFTMKNVYEQAKDLGFEGTLEELIGMFHGTDGKSAYESAVASGYRGTEAQWIASLAGSDGQTPSIGQNGHWYVGDIDTGVSAAGTGVTKIEKTATADNVDTYTISTSDGSEYTFTVTNGKDGKDAVGTGIDKIEKTAVNGKVDTYTITLSDGTEYDYDVVNGVDGKDGKDGVDGADAPALTVRELYDEAVLAGYSGTYLDFIAEYLPSGEEAEKAKINAACFSAVRIACLYNYVYRGQQIMAANFGSGVIYQINKEAGDAYIVTNYHIVYVSDRMDAEGNPAPAIADKIYIYLFGSEIMGSEIEAEIPYEGMYIQAEYIGGSLENDLAVLKVSGSDRIKNSNAKAATLATGDEVSLVDNVYVVGNGGNDGISVTKGIVSYSSEKFIALGADGMTRISPRVFRCDAIINPGSSGGAVLNNRGELCGVVIGKLTITNYEAVGYVIPISVVRNIAENILYYYDLEGEAPVSAKRLLFGIDLRSNETYAEFDVATGRNVFHENVTVESLQDDALVTGKIEAGDVITKVTIERAGISEEYDISRSYVLVDLTMTIRAGDKVTLTYKRMAAGVETEGEAMIEVEEKDLVVVR